MIDSYIWLSIKIPFRFNHNKSNQIRNILNKFLKYSLQKVEYSKKIKDNENINADKEIIMNEINK
jgi:hypothetical protein